MRDSVFLDTGASLAPFLFKREQLAVTIDDRNCYQPIRERKTKFGAFVLNSWPIRWTNTHRLEAARHAHKALRSKRMLGDACSHFCFSVEEVSISEGIIVTEALAIKIGVLNYEYDLAM